MLGLQQQKLIDKEKQRAAEKFSKLTRAFEEEAAVKKIDL
jgi:hypothetical protein